MAMVVTLRGVVDGFYSVDIKREIGTGIESREFSKAGLEEYLETTKAYCKHKGYEYIYRKKISEKEAYAGLDETDINVIEFELSSLIHSDQRTDREMTYHYFLENEDTISLFVYWDNEWVKTFRFEYKINK
ncbi:MAG: hypothetical protein K0S80_2333 [Neobacillus sp.]|nr:hypothetical protein [Neobacillus sp.]